MHENSRLLFDKYALPYFSAGQRVLEIGPDGFPSTYQRDVGSVQGLVWDTLDIIPSDMLTYPNSDPYRFPIDDEAYDVVLAAQVIEHVRKIWVWIQEIQRVCRRGGTAVIINPVSWPYHPVPVDCWRIYPDGVRALLDDTEFEIEVSTFGSLEAAGAHNVPGEAVARRDARDRSLARRVAHQALPLGVRRRMRPWARRLARAVEAEPVVDTITVARRRGSS